MSTQTEIAFEPGAPAATLQDQGRTLVRWCWTICVLFAAVDAWLSRFDMYSDGISYLDLSDAFSKGDWHAAVNAYWSPLYPFLLGIASAVFKPSPYWEFPVVHVVNFLVFVAALLSFQYFFSGFSRLAGAAIWPAGARILPAGRWVDTAAWTALGYALFLWSSLKLISISVVSPDMLVAVFALLAAGILVRVQNGHSGWGWFALLGVVLGFGYLAKAPMLPIGIVFIVCAALAAGPSRGSLRRAALNGALAVMAMLIVAAPFMIALSVSKGRFTVGDSARLNVAWYVDDVPRYHWQGGTQGEPLHPTRKISAQPPAYEFRRPGSFSGTYPVWFDPSYWYEGIRPRLSLKGILRQSALNGLQYYNIVFHDQPAFITAFLVFAIYAGMASLIPAVWRFWPLMVPAAFALCMYLPVHVEDRMTGAFAVMLWTALFAGTLAATLGGVRVAAKQEQSAFLRSGMVAVAAMVLIMLSASLLGTMAPGTMASGSPPHFQYRVAEAMAGMGLHPGDDVAWIRPQPFTSTQTYWWARLGRLYIIAEIPAGQENAFWNADPDSRARVLDAFAATGAKALVATRLPAGASQAAWQPVGNTGYYLYKLN